MLKYLLFFMIIFSLSTKESFTNKFSHNLNTTNTPDFEKFVEYFKWIDDAVTIIIRLSILPKSKEVDISNIAWPQIIIKYSHNK